MTSITNLAIAGAGLTTIGGMVYGSYELLKNVEKPLTDLLKIKKKIPLKKESDTEDWNKNWQQYIKDHTKEVVEQVDSQPATGPAPKNPEPKKITKEVIDEEDTWKLHDWSKQKDKKDIAPESFKNKCEEKFNEQHAGIWAKGYKDFEKYCTKNAPDED